MTHLEITLIIILYIILAILSGIAIYRIPSIEENREGNKIFETMIVSIAFPLAWAFILILVIIIGFMELYSED